MRIEVRIILVMFILCLGVALSCGGGNVDQLQETKVKAESASKAVSGDVISTAEKAGKQEEGEEETTSPAAEEDDGEKDDDGDNGGSKFPTERPSTPTVEPIEGPITVEALAYPHYNPLSGKYERPRIGDVSSYTSITDDPFTIVMGYYDQLLQGRPHVSRNNIGEAEGRMYAEYAVEDGDNVFTINLSATGTIAGTSIAITKS